MMLTNDALGGIKTEACAFAHSFGSKERIEDARLNFRGNARATVADFDDRAIQLTTSAHAEPTTAIHSLNGVVNEIGPDLIEFAAIGAHRGKQRVVVAHHGYAVFQAMAE